MIVVNWNRRDLLHACLESLARQSAGSFEVILVDNGSSDGSAEMAGREFSSTGRFNLRVIRNGENRGFCAANNQGIAVSRTRYIALLNNDAEAEPGWLEALVAAMDAAPEAGMAASKILDYGDPAKIDKVGHLIYLDGQNRGRGTGEPDRGQYDNPGETSWPDGCAAIYRRAMLETIGGFDEDLFAYADDAELGLRARIAGWRCLYVPTAVVRHHRGSTLGVASTHRLALIERNRVLLAAKLFPWSLLWLNGVYYAARLGAGILAAASGEGELRRFPGWKNKLRLATALIQGDLAALIRLPKFLWKRRRISAIRKLTPRQVRELIVRYQIPMSGLKRQAM